MTCLADGSQGGYVPFRDSKLTCLLQQSLGGSGSCLMVGRAHQIGCVNLQEVQVDEAISTLVFAFKASNIVNKPEKLQDIGAGIVSTLQKRVSELESELAKANQQIASLVRLLHRSENGESTDAAEKKQAGGKVFEALAERLDDIRNENIRTSPGELSDRVGGPDQNLRAQFLQTLSVVKELLVSNQSIREELAQTALKAADLRRELSTVIVGASHTG